MNRDAGRLAEPSDEGKKWALVTRLVGVGWFVALTIAGGAIGGLALDAWLGTRPILTIVGVMLGLTVAISGMYRMLVAVLRQRRNDL